ncbi:hypothetical protein [Marinomonas sp. THO17]|uniref:hypothetical protein n=1 Tax=Marinomonas sp. THO17 TaxID=3149048 RepID=UPI00336C258D
MAYNKLLKFTPAAKGAASAGQPTLRFGCPLARRYANIRWMIMLNKFWILFLLMQFTLAYGEDKKVNEYLDFDVAWGGYYAGVSKDSDEISVFRLLDFNRDVYHIAIYQEKFSSIPSEEEIRSLSPFIGHAPIDVKGLLNYKVVALIDSKQLTKEDLVGYMYYLEEFQVSAKDREKLSQSLISFGKEQPLKLKLSIAEGELQINERK